MAPDAVVCIEVVVIVPNPSVVPVGGVLSLVRVTEVHVVVFPALSLIFWLIVLLPSLSAIPVSMHLVLGAFQVPATHAPPLFRVYSHELVSMLFVRLSVVVVVLLIVTGDFAYVVDSGVTVVVPQVGAVQSIPNVRLMFCAVVWSLPSESWQDMYAVVVNLWLNGSRTQVACVPLIEHSAVGGDESYVWSSSLKRHCIPVSPAIMTVVCELLTVSQYGEEESPSTLIMLVVNAEVSITIEYSVPL